MQWCTIPSYVHRRLVMLVLFTLPGVPGDTPLLRRYDLDKYVYKKVFDLIISLDILYASFPQFLTKVPMPV
jgi:hypothetical protein